VSINPVQDALNNLRNTLGEALQGEMSESIRSVREPRDKSIHTFVPPSHSVIPQEATGGEFNEYFYGDAGREAARLFHSVLIQALGHDAWQKMGSQKWPNSPRQPKKHYNHQDPDRGHISFFVDNDNAGLLARNINTLAERVKSHQNEIQKLDTLAQSYGAQLQAHNIAKISPTVKGLLSPEPSFAIEIIVNDKDAAMKNKLLTLSGSPPKSSVLSPRDNADITANATCYTIPIKGNEQRLEAILRERTSRLNRER
jgi:hypothetical protein